MFKAIIAIALAVGAIAGGLLALRRSASAGMPDRDVLERAKRRAQAQRRAEEVDRDN